MVTSGTTAFAKEMGIRKRISSIYNKIEEDFSSLKEYNDYMEEVEGMIVNLADGIDVSAIEARIDEYHRENVDQIMIARARKAEEYAAALAASKGQLPQAGPDLSSSSQTATSHVAQGQYAPAIAGGGIGQPRPMGQPLPLGPGHDGMSFEYEDEETTKLRVDRAARAGGWSLEMSKKRALEEAFAGIWI